jgi:acetyl esterase/lipase
MHRMRTILFLAALVAAFSANAQEQVVKIWPGLAPGTEGVADEEQWVDDREVSKVYQPDLTLFLPAERQAPSAAVVIFPGGGYRKVVMEKEGYKLARWLNDNGIAAFVLKYRLNRDDALRDAQRALSIVRHNAESWGVDKDRIGAMGFSAGAHLTGNLVANHAKRKRHDAIDDVSSRPDFWVSVYGAYKDIIRNAGKRNDLAPAFLVHAGDDSRVPVAVSIELYTQLSEAGVPAELHVYERGEHGFALETDRGASVTSTVESWSARLLEWLKVRSIL